MSVVTQVRYPVPTLDIASSGGAINGRNPVHILCITGSRVVKYCQTTCSGAISGTWGRKEGIWNICGWYLWVGTSTLYIKDSRQQGCNRLLCEALSISILLAVKLVLVLCMYIVQYSWQWSYKWLCGDTLNFNIATREIHLHRVGTRTASGACGQVH